MTEKKAKPKKTKKETFASPELQGLEKPKATYKNPYERFVSDAKHLYVIIGVIIIIFALIMFGARLANRTPAVMSIDDLHELNFKGKLDKDQGYLYNGFSFVKFRSNWFTRFLRQEDGQTYAVELRYGPRDVGDVPIIGDYNFIPANYNSTYITFDPLGNNLSHVALAAADLSSNLAGILQIYPYAACTRNETRGCIRRPIVSCGSGLPIIYLKETPVASIEQRDTCLIISGQELDLIKAVDRWLLTVYGMMETSEEASSLAERDFVLHEETEKEQQKPADEENPQLNLSLT